MGFTLVELLISIAIIGVVTSIVLVKYGSFDSTVLLKGLAYEMALTLREAQVRSVSVARNAGGTETGNFDYPFGVTFSLSNPKQYVLFRYEDGGQTAYPEYGVPAAKDLRVFPISRTMRITELCVYGTALADPCDVAQLDVSFKRPKFKGLFHALSGGGVEYTTTIDRATVQVGSEGGFNQFIVEVTSLGQISVYKAP
jgi:prepilin-type N-terminal cleavage/methylation domain-containing protein